MNVAQTLASVQASDLDGNPVRRNVVGKRTRGSGLLAPLRVNLRRVAGHAVSCLRREDRRARCFSGSHREWHRRAVEQVQTTRIGAVSTVGRPQAGRLSGNGYPTSRLALDLEVEFNCTHS